MAAGTVLFVTYGGGHARMVIPVVRALEACGVQTVTLALTTAAPIFTSEGLPYLGFKDFMEDANSEAMQWGKSLAAKLHNPASGISEAEAVAYFGLSYQDLIIRHGSKKAAMLWQEQGRQSFNPLTVLDRVMDRTQPAMVVTTNSPRSEQAALEVAKTRGIASLAMADLFGVHHFHPLESDYIAVLSEKTIDNLIEEGVKLPRKKFLVTGNPAFDEAFDHCGLPDMRWRQQHFPDLPVDAKTLLWIDVPNYWNVHKRQSHIRSNEEVILDMEHLAQAAKINNAYLLVRPHPQQDASLHREWVKNAPSHVRYAGDLPRHPVLNCVDVAATYTSAMGVEALLMRRRLIQLKYLPGKTDMPLGEWGMSWQANSPQEISGCVRQALHDDAAWQHMQKRTAEILPQEKAAPKISSYICGILGETTTLATTTFSGIY